MTADRAARDELHDLFRLYTQRIVEREDRALFLWPQCFDASDDLPLEVSGDAVERAPDR